MIFCERCGRDFSEDEADIRREHHNEVPGSPYEEWIACPYCGSTELGDMEQCELCGESFVARDMIGGVCEDCVNRERGNWRLCFSMAERYESGEMVTINAFLTSVFDAAAIEDILVEALGQRKKVDCSQYIDQDIGWFADHLAELKGGKNE